MNTFTVDGASKRKRSDYTSLVEKWNNASKKDGLTRPGNDWILQCLDGFHDSNLRFTDYPDGVQGKVVLYHPTSEITITKPPNLAAGATWDCHIATNPFAGGTDDLEGFYASLNTTGSNLGATGTLRGSNLTLAATENCFAAAPVIIDRRPSGQPTFSAAGSTGALNYGCVDVKKNYLRGPSRIVGMAVEVINTTPALYTGGSVVGYEVPMRPMDFTANLLGTEPAGATVWTGTTNNGVTAANVNFETPTRVIAAAAPPTNIDDAVLPGDTVEWEAKNGAYFNAVFEKPPAMAPPDQLYPCWYSQDARVGSDALTVRGAWPTAYPAAAGLSRNLTGSQVTRGTGILGGTLSNDWTWEAAPPRILHVPITRKGIYFTGLPEQTTLALRVRFFIARVPSINDQEIFNLAQLAPPVDRKVWELYAKVVENLPVACQFNENPLGEWFKNVLGVVSRWAPTVGNLVGTVVPGAGLVGQGIGKLAGVAHELANDKKEHRKDQEKIDDRDILIEKLKKQLDSERRVQPANANVVKKQLKKGK